VLGPTSRSSPLFPFDRALPSDGADDLSSSSPTKSLFPLFFSPQKQTIPSPPFGYAIPSSAPPPFDIQKVVPPPLLHSSLVQSRPFPFSRDSSGRSFPSFLTRPPPVTFSSLNARDKASPLSNFVWCLLLLSPLSEEAPCSVQQQPSHFSALGISFSPRIPFHCFLNTILPFPPRSSSWI